MDYKRFKNIPTFTEEEADSVKTFLANCMENNATVPEPDPEKFDEHAEWSAREWDLFDERNFMETVGVNAHVVSEILKGFQIIAEAIGGIFTCMDDATIKITRYILENGYTDATNSEIYELLEQGEWM